MLTAYLITAAVLFGLLSLIWNATDWLNLIIKAIFLTMTVLSVWLAATTNGYLIVVKPTPEPTVNALVCQHGWHYDSNKTTCVQDGPINGFTLAPDNQKQ